MVELKRESRVVRTPVCYKQYIEDTYPKENVKNMIANWKKTIEHIDNFLSSADDAEKNAYENAIKQFEDGIKVEKDWITSMMTKSVEERKEELHSQFLKQADEFLKKFSDENIEKQKQEISKQVADEKKKTIAKFKEEKETAKKGLTIWENPESND